MPAARTFSSVSVQPVTTTGASTMASTWVATNPSTWARWRCTSLSASANSRVMPRRAASAFMSAENAVRQSLSDPTWANPMVDARAAPAASKAAKMMMTVRAVRRRRM